MSKEAAVALQMIDAGDETRFAMVITHDCDCVADPQQEKQVEVILGSQIGKLDGNYTHGKNPRRLHLELSQCGKLVELVTMPRVALEKIVLFAFAPDHAWTLSREEKTILVRWLASRYSRPAFPNELVERLQIVKEDLRKVARKHGEAAIGIFVDFEPSGEINNTEEPYEIGISVVFDGTKKDAAATSSRLRDALNSLFEKAYRQASGHWKGIELVSCEAIPDTEFTYFEAARSHPYRLDDLSLRRTPHEPVPL